MDDINVTYMIAASVMESLCQSLEPGALVQPLSAAVDFGNQRAKATLLNNSEFTATHCIILLETENTMQQCGPWKSAR